MSSVLNYGDLKYFFSTTWNFQLLLWASFRVLMYLECSTSHLPGGSKGCIPRGLSHLCWGEGKRIKGNGEGFSKRVRD